MKIVEFDDEGNQEFHIRSPKISFFGNPEIPTMVKLLLKLRIVKNERQAFFVLIGIILIAGIAAFAIFKKTHPTASYVLDQYGHKMTNEEYARKVKDGSI